MLVNATEYHQSFLKKSSEKPNVFDIKSVTIEHPKASHKLSKTIRQAKKVFEVGAGENFNRPLYSETTKSKKYLDAKSAKVTNRTHTYKRYASTYSIKILNSFYLELQGKDTEYAIRNKLLDLLTQLKRFKFVITLVLEFKKREIDDKNKI